MIAKKRKTDPCWSGYHQYGNKKKNGKTVPNYIKGGRTKKRKKK